ncbi:DivIVA domain-containing protein [Clostridium lundense]|uniref:DivIVA domain-containing protein n=1 Tax=Clostridium lundense TaxID=319475 RepID=UPI00048765E6|nr:DivIVA domain-containing protein [Clostridium lundense]
MKITSMDITSKEFKRGFRGYDMDEVDEFLDKIAEQYEAIYKENSSLKEKLNSIEENLQHYNKMEETIQNTLLLAQNAADQSKKAAQREAEFIIKNANETSKRILDKAHNDVIKINDQFEKTKNEFFMFRTKYKNFMQSQLEMFENMEKDFVKNYNIGSKMMDSELREKDIEINSNDDQKKDNNKFMLEVKEDSKDDFQKDSLEEIKNFFVKD